MFNRQAKKNPVEENKIRIYIYRKLAEREWGFENLLDKIRSNFSGNDLSQCRDILNEFAEDGSQSDHRYALSYVRQCRDTRGYRPIKVKAKLMEHKIASHVIDEVLHPNHAIWTLRAKEERMKKFKGLPDNAKEKAKQSRFLQQRGFSFSQINQSFDTDIDDAIEITLPEDEE